MTEKISALHGPCVELLPDQRIIAIADVQRPARRSSTSKPSKTLTKEQSCKSVSPLEFLISLQLTPTLNSSGMHLSQPSTKLVLKQSATPHASTETRLTRTIFKTSLNACMCQNDITSLQKRKEHQHTKAETQQKTSDIKNKWWEEKTKAIYGLANQHDMRNFFQATKALYGPSSMATLLSGLKTGLT